MTRVKIEDYSNYEKDTESKGIVSVDRSALAAYKKQREMLTKTITVNEKINNLEKELSEIKQLLFRLVDTSKINKD
jgi:hypothetical protein